MIDLDELERLDKAATPGPWNIEKRDGDMGEKDHNIYADGDVCALHENARPLRHMRRQSADAKMIATLRNALPTLIAELRLARAREEARMAHLNQIDRGTCSPYTCSADGYREAMEKAEAERDEADEAYKNVSGMLIEAEDERDALKARVQGLETALSIEVTDHDNTKGKAEKLRDLEYVDYHGCCTGDCPHGTERECAKALIQELQHVSDTVREALSETATPTTKEKPR